jgi:hypothetical protein
VTQGSKLGNPLCLQQKLKKIGGTPTKGYREDNKSRVIAVIAVIAVIPPQQTRTGFPPRHAKGARVGDPGFAGDPGSEKQHPETRRRLGRLGRGWDGLGYPDWDDLGTHWDEVGTNWDEGRGAEGAPEDRRNRT